MMVAPSFSLLPCHHGRRWLADTRVSWECDRFLWSSLALPRTPLSSLSVEELLVLTQCGLWGLSVPPVVATDTDMFTLPVSSMCAG